MNQAKEELNSDELGYWQAQLKQHENEAKEMEYWQARLDHQENDVKFMAGQFESEKFAWKSIEEMEAYQAQQDINLARRRLIDLQKEIDVQLNVIEESQSVIKKYKTNLNAGKENKAGRPKISEYHKEIVNKFMAKWIHSLMDLLEVRNCRELEESLEAITTLNSERNWRRWLNGSAIPTYKSFETLLNSKVTVGKYAKQSLLTIPSEPNPDDLLMLIRFT